MTDWEFTNGSVTARSLRRFALAGLTGLWLFALTGLAGAAEHVVVIRDFAFIEQEITVRQGDTVRWENQEKRQYHSVWFEQLDEEEPDYFFPDETYERTFEDVGSFPYRCGPHPKMTGVVHVTE